MNLSEPRDVVQCFAVHDLIELTLRQRTLKTLDAEPPSPEAATHCGKKRWILRWVHLNAYKPFTSTAFPYKFLPDALSKRMIVVAICLAKVKCL